MEEHVGNRAPRNNHDDVNELRNRVVEAILAERPKMSKVWDGRLILEESIMCSSGVKLRDGGTLSPNMIQRRCEKTQPHRTPTPRKQVGNFHSGTEAWRQFTLNKSSIEVSSGMCALIYAQWRDGTKKKIYMQREAFRTGFQNLSCR